MCPTITVITPHYQSRTLFRSIDSVFIQSYPDIQYIVVVDGTKGYSVEEIRQYMQQYAPERVRWCVIGLSQNMGTVYALNTALSKARGEYIFNLADDDVFTGPEVLAGWTEYMVRSHSLICTAKRRMTDDASGRIWVEPRPQQIEKIESRTPQELFDDLAVSNYVFGSSTAQSRACFAKYGGYDSQYRLTEDYPRIMKLLRNGVRLDFYSAEVVCCQSNGISSPGRIINLLDENERIYEEEILPYCSNPARTGVKHRIWKLKTVRHARFQSQYEKSDKWYEKCGLYIRYPENIIRVLKRKGRRG